MKKTTVVVCRKWAHPEIEVKVCKESIEIEMKMEDFIHALCLEAKNPTLLVTVKQMEARLKEAATKVVSAMKKETTKVM